MVYDGTLDMKWEEQLWIRTPDRIRPTVVAGPSNGIQKTPFVKLLFGNSHD